MTPPPCPGTNRERRASFANESVLADFRPWRRGWLLRDLGTWLSGEAFPAADLLGSPVPEECLLSDGSGCCLLPDAASSFASMGQRGQGP